MLPDLVADLPNPAEDPTAGLDEAIAAEARPAPANRPWLAVNMVVSLDGSTAVGGVSGPLGSDVDSEVFHALRGIADVVLAGSTTVTIERYRPANPSESVRAARVARGQTEVPRLAVVSNRGDIDLALPMFSRGAESSEHAAPPPIVLVAAEAVPTDRLHQLEEAAEVIATGDRYVDLPAAMAELRNRGIEVIMSEGGPTLNGVLIGDDLIDEWCLTLAPWLAAGTSARASFGSPIEELRRFDLVRAWHHDSELLLRYIRAEADTSE